MLTSPAGRREEILMKAVTQATLLAAIGNHFESRNPAPVTLTIGKDGESRFIQISDAPHSVLEGVFDWLKTHKDTHFATAHLHNGALHIS